MSARIIKIIARIVTCIVILAAVFWVSYMVISVQNLAHSEQNMQIPTNQSGGTWIIQTDGEEQVMINTLTGKRIHAAVRTTDNGLEELDLEEYARMLNQNEG